jgi:hypothetical protein
MTRHEPLGGLKRVSEGWCRTEHCVFPVPAPKLVCAGGEGFAVLRTGCVGVTRHPMRVHVCELAFPYGRKRGQERVKKLWQLGCMRVQA